DTNDGGGIIEAEIHLAKRPKLFRQTEPALRARDRSPSSWLSLATCGAFVFGDAGRTIFSSAIDGDLRLAVGNTM
ncbi:hypothetical protein, partial [Rhizobium leguminosarum]